MPSPGDRDRGLSPEQARERAIEIARESGRSTRRSMLLLLGLLVVVTIAQQAGLLGGGQAPAPVTLDRADFDRELDRLPFVPELEGSAGGPRVVEFLDYRCDHCRRMASTIHGALAEDPSFELVPIEYPVLGPESELAARFALAAALQGGYGPYHRALMFSTVPYNHEGLVDLGEALGLDPDRLRTDAEGAEVTAILEANRALAARAGVEGTPTFIIGDQVIVGAIDEPTLLGLIAAQRAP